MQRTQKIIPVRFDKKKSLETLIQEYQNANYDPYFDFRDLAKFYSGKSFYMPDINKIPLSESLRDKINRNQANISEFVISEFNEFSSNQSLPISEYTLDSIDGVVFIAPDENITLNISGVKKIVLPRDNYRLKVKSDRKILFVTYGSLRIQNF